MDNNEIKKITDKVVSPCLVGIRSFDADVQQYTCKFINGEKCECYRNYKQALVNIEDREKPKSYYDKERMIWITEEQLCPETSDKDRKQKLKAFLEWLITPQDDAEQARFSGVVDDYVGLKEIIETLSESELVFEINNQLKPYQLELS